jgi:hypothetical protein
MRAGLDRVGVELPSPGTTPARASNAASALGRLPLHFVPNQGQMEPATRYVVQAGRRQVSFLDAGLRLSLRDDVRDRALSLHFAGARKKARPVASRPAKGTVNYFLGRDPSRWRTGLPTYLEVSYAGLYPGVDVSYTGQGGELESTFTVSPGARLSDIRISIMGARDAMLDRDGNLRIATRAGVVRESKPKSFQLINGVRKEIAVRFWLDRASRTYGFRAEGGYDAGRPLIIDPLLGFASFLGGDSQDSALGIAVDNSGQIYITGVTFSSNFPAQSAFQAAGGGGGDAFVTKVAANGSALVYSTFLGGGARDEGKAIAVDPNTGQVHLTGITFSNDFPLASALRGTNAGRGDAFVVSLSDNGQTLLYSTFFGGTEQDSGNAIAVNTVGDVYLAGQTFSPDFPSQNAFQTALRGVADAFVAKIGAGGQTLAYSTFLGGSDVDGANAIAIDGSGQAHVAGFTSSINFPIQSAFQSGKPGSRDAFVTKLTASGNGLVFSTYLGGSEDDEANALSLDSTGNTFITGYTGSADFPAANAYQASNKGGTDAFLTRLSSSGASVTLSTYLGGAGQDVGVAIGRDGNSQIYVAGTTSSTDFPVSNALRASLSGPTDAFVTEFAVTGSALLFSTYLGGSSQETAQGMVVDAEGKIYLVGETLSPDFPTLTPHQTVFGGGASDAFYLRIDPLEPDFETTLYFPRLVTNDGSPGGPENSEFTGVAVANLSAASAVLRFTAFDVQGKLLSGTDIANPAQIALGAKGQLALVDTQVFGAGLAARKPEAWFRMQSTVTGTVGFFLVFNSTLGVLDGAGVSSQTMTGFIFPEVEDQGFTQLHVANPNANPATVTLELYDANGSIRATGSRTIEPNGVLVESVATLFSGVASFEGGMHIRCASTLPVVPFEYLGKNGQYVEGLNGQDLSSGARIIYSPQYAVGGPWRTTLSVVNFGNTPANLVLKLIDDNGASLGTRAVSLAAKGKFQAAAQDFFVAPSPDSITQGYVEITSDTANIGGAVVFGDPGRNRFSSALPLVSKLITDSVFSQLASDSEYFTGLAVLNPGDVDASFVLDVFNKEGSMLASKTVQIAARSRISLLLTQYFPSLPSVRSGYFRITSSRGLLSFALFGTNSLSALSAVPPQMVPSGP